MAATHDPMVSKVSIVKCSDYERARVRSGIHDLLAPIGGMAAFVAPGQKVLIKPNLIAGTPPERGATTHPEVLRAVIEEVRDAGGTPMIGESPAYESFRSAARKSGLLQVMEEMGVDEAPFDRFRDVELGRGHIIPSLPIAEPALDADVIISLPKLKAHGLVMYTGCVKNMFGVIYGTKKAKFHLRFQDRESFSALLAEIYRVAKPTLSILDGIIAMEGNGPRNGDSVNMGILLAGADGLAVDTVACSIIGVDPMESGPLAAAAKLGVGAGSLRDIETVGARIADLKVESFDVPVAARPSIRRRAMSGRIGLALRNLLTTRPSVVSGSCKACKVCALACPAEAIVMADGVAKMDYSKCIRCYCCQEICEHGAIVLTTPPLARLFR